MNKLRQVLLNNLDNIEENLYISGLSVIKWDNKSKELELINSERVVIYSEKKNNRIRELEHVLILIVGSLFYGDFKTETPNEKTWFQILKDLGMYPKDEDHYLELSNQYKKEN